MGDGGDGERWPGRSGRRSRCGAGDAGHRSVPDDARQRRDERVDRHGRQGRRYHGHRYPDRHHLLHVGDGVTDDHRRQDRQDHRAQAGVRHRLRDLRDRFVHHGDRPEPHGVDDRLVGARGHRCSAHPPVDRRARRLELPARPTATRLRTCRLGRGDRSCRRPLDRRAVHHVLVVALRVRRRSDRGARHPRDDSQDRRRRIRGAREARPGRHRTVGGGARVGRVRDPEGGGVGLRPAEGGRPAVARVVADGVGGVRRWRSAVDLRAVGRPSDPPWRRAAARPADAEKPGTAQRTRRLPHAVPGAGGTVLRHSALPVRLARTVGDRHRRATVALCRSRCSLPQPGSRRSFRLRRPASSCGSGSGCSSWPW